jgi:hypothetical protein
MTKFFDLIKALLPQIESQHDHDEAYLAKAVDVVDLERRVRELDQRARAWHPGPQFAVGMR